MVSGHELAPFLPERGVGFGEFGPFPVDFRRNDRSPCGPPVERNHRSRPCPPAGERPNVNIELLVGDDERLPGDLDASIDSIELGGRRAPG